VADISIGAGTVTVAVGSASCVDIGTAVFVVLLQAVKTTINSKVKKRFIVSPFAF
jgi:hypothetical protein